MSSSLRAHVSRRAALSHTHTQTHNRTHTQDVVDCVAWELADTALPRAAAGGGAGATPACAAACTRALDLVARRGRPRELVLLAAEKLSACGRRGGGGGVAEMRVPLAIMQIGVRRRRAGMTLCVSDLCVCVCVRFVCMRVCPICVYACVSDCMYACVSDCVYACVFVYAAACPALN